MPYLTVGATDARFFRRHGITSYGFGLFSQQMTFEDYGSMFHGDNERIDIESLGLSIELWDAASPATSSPESAYDAARDPGRALRLRWRHPLVALRGVRRVRARPAACRRASSAQVNATNPDTNAWAQLERSEVDLDEFAELFAAEAAALGHAVDGHDVLGLLAGEMRPAMVEAVRRCSERLITGLLTNNFVAADGRGDAGRARSATVLALFDAVIESSKVGVRKPDPLFYEIACEQLGIEPAEAVFLDDLGVNLKPARAHGHAHDQGDRSRRRHRRARTGRRLPPLLTMARPDLHPCAPLRVCHRLPAQLSSAEVGRIS